MSSFISCGVNGRHAPKIEWCTGPANRFAIAISLPGKSGSAIFARQRRPLFPDDAII
ncbi:hypothetical protein L1S32_08285 [Methanogenium sp. S4BF]|uniref:hypothetical protein n=1 Tax=Methanogenium sp. S4BF TaxID=1789226 RepID=UPI002415D365|nr:hypothetical protein [Methanogenium sp. S4BF]WFN33839.1 hypothetical protein L1S32_08285 [Methanogenium sp. S4BF]